MDFTLKVYRRLLQALIDAGYMFQTFADFIESAQPRAVVLRHDVDRLPGELEIRATLPEISFRDAGLSENFQKRAFREVFIMEGDDDTSARFGMKVDAMTAFGAV